LKEAQVDARIMVTELLDGLGDRQREALLLRYVSQLTIPEIAKVMDARRVPSRPLCTPPSPRRRSK